MLLEKSICGKLVRITVGREALVMSIGEWSRCIANPTMFTPTAAERGEAEVIGAGLATKRPRKLKPA